MRRPISSLLLAERGGSSRAVASDVATTTKRATTEAVERRRPHFLAVKFPALLVVVLAAALVACRNVPAPPAPPSYYPVAGWVFITPHDELGSDGSVIFDEHSPLETWEHTSSYDTAAECEAFKQRMIEFNQKMLEDSHKGLVRLFSVGRCVPAAYLYPPKKAEER